MSERETTTDLVKRLEATEEVWRLQGKIADPPAQPSWWPYVAAQVAILVFVLAPAAALLKANGGGG